MALTSDKFDRRIGIERLDETGRSALNEVVGVWRLVGQAFAARQDLRDVEKLTAGAEMSALQARFTLQGTSMASSITPADRLVLRGSWDAEGVRTAGELWTIAGVKEVGAAPCLEIEVTAVKNRETQV